MRDVRVVDVDDPHAAATTPVDIRVTDGVVTAVEPHLTRQDGEEVHDAGGRYAIPGLWDAHVHMGQWAASYQRLDLSEATSVAEVCAQVARHIATLPHDGGVVTVDGIGFRSPTWAEQPTVAPLDAISGDHPVVLISGDCHSGWLNSRALSLLGLGPRDGLLVEQEWFDVFPRLHDLPGLAEQAVTGYRQAVARAHSRGITGIVDLEFTRGVDEWPSRVTDLGIDTLRVRVGTYADGLDDVIAAGLRTGDVLLEGHSLVTMGPLKIISDGSLTTRTAYCCEPYADADQLDHARGMQNVAPEELRTLLGRARDHGLDVALHAIGDAAVSDALDAFEVTRARGTIEHAQLVAWEDFDRMARLGITASVQPAHLLDDRDVARQCWPDRVDRCFAFRTLQQSGVRLAMGSDAPVSPLDPWLAIAAAVHRSADERDPWIPHQALTAPEALAASLDGAGTLGVGSVGDVVLLDRHPYEVPSDSREASAALRAMTAAATFVAGRRVHG
ncbi:MAG: amidohydrolase [Mobilicoccus sp.]|nr:amidohydrolase [Mobilicoccus sp.]